MRRLFESAFRGNDEMYAKAVHDLDEAIAKYGADHAMQFPDTAYNCATILEYTGINVKTLADLKQALDALYVKYGCFAEKTINLVMPGLDGLKNMKLLMADLRNEPLKEIGGTKVIRIRDYQDGSIYVAGLGKVETMDMKNSNILYYELEDGTSFIVRPSGTEPKVKVYIMTRGESMDEAWGKIDTYSAFAQTLKR